MKTTFIPEIIFVQSNILFITNKYLENILLQYIKDDQEIISIDCITLWELIISEKKQKKLALHIDYPNISDVITINFNEDDTKLLLANNDFDTLGILINYSQERDKYKTVLFITNISEGLKMIIDNE
ncbi:MAG: hypothetical protein AB7V16_01800 [Vulcanibacillus sp.]